MSVTWYIKKPAGHCKHPCPPPRRRSCSCTHPQRARPGEEATWKTLYAFRAAASLPYRSTTRPSAIPISVDRVAGVMSGISQQACVRCRRQSTHQTNCTLPVWASRPAGSVSTCAYETRPSTEHGAWGTTESSASDHASGKLLPPARASVILPPSTSLARAHRTKIHPRPFGAARIVRQSPCERTHLSGCHDLQIRTAS